MSLMIKKVLYILSFTNVLLSSGYLAMYRIGLAGPPNRSPDIGGLESLIGFLIVPFLPVAGTYLSSRFDLLKMEDGYSAMSEAIWIALSAAGLVTFSWVFYVEVLAGG